MNLEDDILIEKFLRSKLSKEERILFINRLDSDVEFNNKFGFEKELFQSLNEEEWSSVNNTESLEVKEYQKIFKSDEVKNLKQLFKRENNVYQKGLQSKSKSWMIYVAAASCILFFSIFSLVYFKENSQELYVSYLEKTELTSVITRGSNQKELVIAQSLFENKEYKKALDIFEKEIKNKENKIGSVYIYIGIAQMELNQFDKAVITFDKLINSDLLDSEKGYWFKALLFLKKDNYSKAELVLNKIINEKFYNYQKAKELLKELD